MSEISKKLLVKLSANSLCLSACIHILTIIIALTQLVGFHLNELPGLHQVSCVSGLYRLFKGQWVFEVVGVVGGPGVLLSLNERSALLKSRL